MLAWVSRMEHGTGVEGEGRLAARPKEWMVKVRERGIGAVGLG